MEWKELNSESQLKEILEKSKEKNQVIFKHSTRCSISKTVWNRMERANSLPENANYYYLDLIANRDISNSIAETLQVQHESPQVIIIKDEKATYDADHFDITSDELEEHLS
ncbi:MAG: bacillithiol system redox-active protein YtxJ [Pseudopedobacter saltans]|uniref:Bacillithiol system redox-active protein YtxJ n=1 Tax=Pseudopedobacter saltans TaxID=151895 RepID=A0A2W5F823_9SPHI|nr:MAG: bacillithiol system redox-active protein YtxJ [Pseudopedobacter saltans]